MDGQTRQTRIHIHVHCTRTHTNKQGKDYTQFVLKCQWGYDASAMESWMEAHRFSEFHSLDKRMRDVMIKADPTCKERSVERSEVKRRG